MPAGPMPVLPHRPRDPQVLLSDGLSYFFDGRRLFLKLVDPGNSETKVVLPPLPPPPLLLLLLRTM